VLRRLISPVPAARHWFVVTLLVALAGDAVFIGLHLLRAYLNDTGYQGFLLDPRWWLEQDRGFSEMYQYAKTALLTGLLVALYVRTRALTCLAWAVAFGYVLADDSLRLHENFGHRLGPRLERLGVLPQIGDLRPQTYAEPLLVLGVGAVVLVLLALGYRKRSSRPLTHRLVVAAFLLAFSATVIDALHSAVGYRLGRIARLLIGTGEDGGEMLAVSLALAIVVAYTVELRRVSAQAVESADRGEVPSPV
jgi:hypothetical protein